MATYLDLASRLSTKQEAQTLQGLGISLDLNSYCATMGIEPMKAIDILRNVLSDEIKTEVFVSIKDDGRITFERLNRDGSTAEFGIKRFSKIVSRFENIIRDGIADEKRKEIFNNLTIGSIIEAKVRKVGTNWLFLDYGGITVSVAKNNLPYNDMSDYTQGQLLILKIISKTEKRLIATRMDKDIIQNLIETIINRPISFNIFIPKKRKILDFMNFGSNQPKKNVFVYVNEPFHIDEIEKRLINNFDFNFTVLKNRRQDILNVALTK